MANLECFIDFDDEWIQEDCHWKYDRIFTITWKINGVSTIPVKEFYYRIGTYSENWGDYIRIATPTEKSLRNDTKSWSYDLRLSSVAINTLLNTRSTEGWLPITAYLKVKDSAGNTSEAHYTYDYYLELPPKPVENLKTSLVVNNPGELKCSWNKAKLIGEAEGKSNENTDSVDGYTVEMKRCLADDDPTKDENYSYVGNLTWDENELANGKYKLILTEDTRNLTIPETAGITTFVNTVINTEVYIDGENNTEFYFEPKQLGIAKGDYYKFTVYPHSHYSSEHTLITSALNDAQSTDPEEVPKGIVRVFNGTSWVEGEVWVMVYDEAEQKNIWKVADSIYVMTDDGTGKGVWKETT